MVSPKECEEFFLPINNFQGQRPLQPAKARRYADSMEIGAMRLVPLDVATGPGGIQYLMNGQHSCHAIVMYGKPFKAIVSHYACDTEEDLWRLFATFDVHATRTQNQIMKGARPFLKDERLRELSLRTLSSCSSALVILGDKGKPIFGKNTIADKTIKVAAVDSHADEVVWVSKFSEHKHMNLVGVITAMIATRRKNCAQSEEFWSKVADGVGLPSKDDPRYKLRAKLLDSGWGASNSRNQHFFIYATCVGWWNTFMTGERRNGVKVASMKEAPEIVASGNSSAGSSTLHRKAHSAARA